MEKQEENIDETLSSIAEARDIIESLGEACPVYVGFSKETYVVTGEQMWKICFALYLADNELMGLSDTQCKCHNNQI